MHIFADLGKALTLSHLRYVFNHEILERHEKEPAFADWAVFPVWSPALRRSEPRERGTPNGSHGARDRRRGQPVAGGELNHGFQDGTDGETPILPLGRESQQKQTMATKSRFRICLAWRRLPSLPCRGFLNPLAAMYQSRLGSRRYSRFGNLRYATSTGSR